MAIRYLHNGEDALKILRETDEDLWNSNIPDTSNLTLEEVKRKYPNLTWDEDIKIGGRLYREAVAYCESLNNQLEAPIQLSPIELELEKGVFTQWRRCHQNVNACIEKYGGYKKLGFIIRRLKYSALEGELHSVWVDSRGAFGEPGKILDVTPDNPRDFLSGSDRLFSPFNIKEGVFTESPNAFYYPTSQGGNRLIKKRILARQTVENPPVYWVVNEDVFRYQEQLYIPGFKDTGFDVVKEVDNG
jgi:hypothetical protein